MTRTHFDPLLGLRPTRQVSPQPVFLVPEVPAPPAPCGQPLPCGHRRHDPDDRRLLPLPAYLDAQDAEAAFVVVESDPLDHTGDFLESRVCVQGLRQSYLEIHFPMEATGFAELSFRTSRVSAASDHELARGRWSRFCYFFGYPTDCAKMILCCGCNFRVLASARLSTLARTTVASSSEEQYR